MKNMAGIENLKRKGFNMKKEFDFKMSIKEFNERCISKGQATAEFDLRPVDMATKDGVSWNIETKDNEVYFYKVVENATNDK